ncbi:uncharacterized protein [Montipora capricornis]|uniref:uncharacterized protein n=1 Tax=Montipora capricornis TaxID=246305 RepID=UPI0035F1258D
MPKCPREPTEDRRFSLIYEKPFVQHPPAKGFDWCIQQCGPNFFYVTWPNGSFKSAYIVHHATLVGIASKLWRTHQDCTPRSDTLCSGTCVQGYFYNNSTLDCQKCSHWCNAGEDEKQQECINQGLHVIHCAPRPDKQCGPASTTNREQQHTVSKIALILSCVGIIIAVLLGAGFAYCAIRIWRRRIRRRNEGYNTGNCASDAVIVLATNDGSQNIGYESRNSTPNESRRDTAFHADDESMVVKDKPYKREKKEKNGNSYPPFTVEEHPKTQTQQEDSRVELKCIVKGKPKEVIYQWFKDEEELPEEKSPSLIRDPLKVKHFGSYKCELRSCDADQHNLSFVTSHTAELDVTPSDGTRYSLLEEVFKENFNTREKVEKLLCKEISGCPAWKQVASSYKHEDLSSFARCKNPGEEVIDFLLSSNPNLSVYNFCKKLKEKSIRRLDIVAALEDFLVQNDGRPNGVGKI